MTAASPARAPSSSSTIRMRPGRDFSELAFIRTLYPGNVPWGENAQKAGICKASNALTLCHVGGESHFWYLGFVGGLQTLYNHCSSWWNSVCSLTTELQQRRS